MALSNDAIDAGNKRRTSTTSVPASESKKTRTESTSGAAPTPVRGGSLDRTKGENLFRRRGRLAKSGELARRLKTDSTTLGAADASEGKGGGAANKTTGDEMKVDSKPTPAVQLKIDRVRDDVDRISVHVR